MYLLCFYAPEADCESVKNAIFAAGGGNIGEYAKCCWQTLGEGQFLPLAGSHPALGQQGSVEKVSEYKVELVVPDELIHIVVKAMKHAHPYEQPAYQVIKLEDIY